MEVFNVHEAKTHLSRLLAMVESGKEVVIARNGKPAVSLNKYAQPDSKPKRREPGGLTGEIWYADDWMETDPEIIEAATYGPIFPDEDD